MTSSTFNGNGAASPSKPTPLSHPCCAPECDRWGSFGHDVGGAAEKWYCRRHDPAGGKGLRGMKGGGAGSPG